MHSIRTGNYEYFNLLRHFNRTKMKRILAITITTLLFSFSYGQKPRARDLGVPFVGTPGQYNAITDVIGVEVGYSTLISGNGENIVGKGPIRTGVTAIFPRGKAKKFSPVYANWYSLNGNGEMTGTTWVTESGFLETPIMITNTNSVGVVRDAVLKWYVDTFKGGTGTSSRVTNIHDSTYTVGVIVQSNFGAKRNLTIAGIPVGMELKDTLNYVFNAPPQSRRQDGDGSIIVIVATDAPLLPHQLKRIAQRIPLGVGIVGGRGSNGSGDIFLAFSTANENAFNRKEITKVETTSNDQLMPLFEATVQAVEEAIINAMVAAETMEGINGNKAYALPHDLLIETLIKYNRLRE